LPRAKLALTSAQNLNPLVRGDRWQRVMEELLETADAAFRRGQRAAGQNIRAV
jgi:hypothetical protein